MARNANKSEPDVQRDDQVANARQTGGVTDPDARDQHSTTGTTPNETYVGRVAGADPGYEEETGAERRARASEPDEG